MIQRCSILALFLGIAFLSHTQGQKQHKDIRRLGDFTTIVNQTDEELIFTDRGVAGTLIAQGSKAAIESLAAEVEGNTLTLTRKPAKNHLRNVPFFDAKLIIADPLRIVISCPALDHYTTQSSGSTTLVSQRFQNLKIEAAGEGSVHLTDCRFYSIDAKLQGSGNIVFEKCAAVDVRLQLEGPGDLLAHNLRSKNVNALLFGKGNLTTWPSHFLNAKVVGPGKLLYRDNPPSLEKQTQDGGTIDRYFPTSGTN